MRLWTESGKYFPPGYEYEKERNAACLLLGLAAVFSLFYFVTLYGEWRSLYYVDKTLGRMVRPHAVADSFLQLAWGYGAFFLSFFLFLAAAAAARYSYYYRDTRSIYLMKRLPLDVTLRSCIQTPLLGMAVGAAVLAVLCLLYYGAYLLVIPAECLPRFL